MVKETLTLTVDPTSALARARANASFVAPVVLDINGVRYTVVPEDPFANYDPQAAMAALRENHGIFESVDVDQLLRELREQRGHCS